MILSADFREFIGLLNSRNVEYLIVGAHSLAFHARPRYTGDLDVYIRPTAENAAKVAAVLAGMISKQLLVQNKRAVAGRRILPTSKLSETTNRRYAFV